MLGRPSFVTKTPSFLTSNFWEMPFACLAWLMSLSPLARPLTNFAAVHILDVLGTSLPYTVSTWETQFQLGFVPC
jgi:hypothetical protein